MKLPTWNNVLRRQPTTIVAATANPEALANLWKQTAPLQIREVRTTDGLSMALSGAHLVILDPADLTQVDLGFNGIHMVLRRAGIPHTDSRAFLADPRGWLDAGRAFNGDIRHLPHRLVAFTSLGSGGVGKTTLTLSLALAFAGRTHLPVAIMELTQGASGFLAVLDGEQFSTQPVDVYQIISQDAQPATWNDSITVVPMLGETASLLSADQYAALLARTRRDYVLTIVDAAQPHPLWYAARDAADRIFVVASAERPDTVANARSAWDDLHQPHPDHSDNNTRSDRIHPVLNMASATDRLANRLVQDRPWITVRRQSSVAHYTDPLPQIVTHIWSGVRL